MATSTESVVSATDQTVKRKVSQVSDRPVNGLARGVALLSELRRGDWYADNRSGRSYCTASVNLRQPLDQLRQVRFESNRVNFVPYLLTLRLWIGSGNDEAAHHQRAQNAFRSGWFQNALLRFKRRLLNRIGSLPARIDQFLRCRPEVALVPGRRAHVASKAGRNAREGANELRCRPTRTHK